jgi:hypothetical protein
MVVYTHEKILWGQPYKTHKTWFDRFDRESASLGFVFYETKVLIDRFLS